MSEPSLYGEQDRAKIKVFDPKNKGKKGPMPPMPIGL